MPLLVDNDAAHILIYGDFNCSPGSRFFNYFIDFADCRLPADWETMFLTVVTIQLFSFFATFCFLGERHTII